MLESRPTKFHASVAPGNQLPRPGVPGEQQTAEADGPAARHNRVKEFKSSNAQCSDAEWEQILISTLTDGGGSADGIETKVDCRSDDEATLHFRKNIQGIAVSVLANILPTDSHEGTSLNG